MPGVLILRSIARPRSGSSASCRKVRLEPLERIRYTSGYMRPLQRSWNRDAAPCGQVGTGANMDAGHAARLHRRKQCRGMGLEHRRIARCRPDVPLLGMAADRCLIVATCFLSCLITVSGNQLSRIPSSVSTWAFLPESSPQTG